MNVNCLNEVHQLKSLLDNTLPLSVQPPGSPTFSFDALVNGSTVKLQVTVNSNGVQVTSSTGQILPVHTVEHDDMRMPFVEINSENIPIPLVEGPLGTIKLPLGHFANGSFELPAPKIPSNLLISPPSCLPAIKRIEFANGMESYFGYLNGIYRYLPSPIDLFINNKELKLVAHGILPDIEFYDQDGIAYPLMVSVKNGVAIYYINVNGIAVKLPSDQMLGHGSWLAFVTLQQLPYPPKTIVGANGQLLYLTYRNGYYQQVPASFPLSINGKNVTASLTGSLPNLQVRLQSGQTYPITYALEDGLPLYLLYLDGSYIALPIGQNLEFAGLVPTPLPPASLKQPIKQLNSNGQTINFIYYNGQYKQLPSTLAIVLNGIKTTFTLQGSPPNLKIVNSKGVAYPIQIVWNGQIPLIFANINGQNIQIPLPNLSTASAFPTVIAQAKIQHPIQVVATANGPVYSIYSNGIYSEIPSSFKININGNQEEVKLTGTPPNVKAILPSGLTLPIICSIVNGELVYYLDINGLITELPLSKLVTTPPTTSIPIKQLSVNGQTIYYIYSNGDYRELPSIIELTINGVKTSYVLQGIPPNVVAVGANGQRYPLKLIWQNGSPLIFVNINGLNIELPLQNLQSAPTFPKIVNENEIQHPIKAIQGTNGQFLYSIYVNGIYEMIPSSFEITINGQSENVHLTGNSQNLQLVLPTGQTYRIQYSLENGVLCYYIYVNGVYIQLPLTQIVPSTSSVPTSLPIFQQQLNGQVVYYIYYDGVYKELPSAINLPNIGLTLHLQGTPPNLILQSATGVSYPVQIVWQNNLPIVFANINGIDLELPLGNLETSSTFSFLVESQVSHPIQVSFNANGQPLYSVYVNGIYENLPSTFQITINGQSQSVHLTGTSASNVQVTLANGQTYPILYGLQNGELVYYIDINAVFIILPLGQLAIPPPTQPPPTLPPPTQPPTTQPPPTQPPPPTQILPITQIQYPIQEIVGTNGQARFIAYVNGSYQFIPSSYTLTINGQPEQFSLTGIYPNFQLTNSFGSNYPIYYSLENGIYIYFIYIANGYVEIPIPPGPSFTLYTGPQFLYSIQEVNQNSQIEYVAYLNGKYVPILNQYVVSVNGIYDTFTLIGTPPNVQFQDLQQNDYPVWYGYLNGSVVYYIDVNGQFIQIPIAPNPIFESISAPEKSITVFEPENGEQAYVGASLRNQTRVVQVPLW